MKDAILVEKYIEKLRSAFKEMGEPEEIPKLKQELKKGNYFKAKLTTEGIEVDNLRNESLLPMEVFRETIELLIENRGKARKGNCMGRGKRLGDAKLSIDSIEGRIAQKVYNAKLGDSVFRRITPISCILAWAGICKNKRGYLELNYI